MAIRSAIINVMCKAAEKAARSLRRDFGEVEQLQVSQKGPADFVSTADHKAEKLIKEELKKGRPGFGFLMEESGAESGSDQDSRWIVDPLDGTSNFLHGIPHFCTSIALEVKGEITAGVIFDPIKDELFYAEKGAGAFLNDRRIRVSGRKNLNESLLATGIPFRGHGQIERFQQQIEKAMRETAGIRRFGAAALDLAYVACGRYEGFWEEFLSPWDIAAGLLLVKEAGGYVSNLQGKRVDLSVGEILASNNMLHAPIQNLVGH